jgi:diaminohydroxyphosphoribosylaminopyrimidine deaminase/5-amino-6-(5-phosphoribosylamino)uracil reductase
MTSPSEHMHEALSLAKKGLLTTRPNPMVGCVITLDNKIIGRGWHKMAGEGHAEIRAIQDVFKNLGSKAESALARSEMFVTLEPCSTTGKTPPCSEAIKKHKIKKVYIASADTSQNGFARKEKDIEIIEGLLEFEARELNRGFFSRIEKNRPFITAKMATGLDGGIALASGESKWITSEISRKDVHKLRATNEAILTGTGTVLKDDPTLTSRDSGYDMNEVKQPLRVVIDRNHSLTGQENIFSEGAKTLIFTTQNSKIKSNTAEICIMSKQDLNNLNLIMEYLANEKSINTLLIESGSRIFDALLADKLIDEFILYQAPKLLGKEKKTFSKFGETNQKLSTIGFEINTITNLGQDKKIVLTPNYK